MCVLHDAADVLHKAHLKTAIFKILRFLPLDSQIMFVCAELPQNTLEIGNKLMKRPIQIIRGESGFPSWETKSFAVHSWNLVKPSERYS